MIKITILDFWGLGDTLILHKCIENLPDKFIVNWVVRFRSNFNLLRHINKKRNIYFFLTLPLKLFFTDILIIPHGYKPFKRFLLRTIFLHKKCYEVAGCEDYYKLYKYDFFYCKNEIYKSKNIMHLNYFMFSDIENNRIQVNKVNNFNEYVLKFSNLSIFFNAYFSPNKKSNDYSSLIIFPGSNMKNKIKRLNFKDIKAFNFFSVKYVVIGPEEDEKDFYEFVTHGFKLKKIDTFSMLDSTSNNALILCSDNFFSHYLSLFLNLKVFVIDKVGNANKYQNNNIGIITRLI